MRTTKSAFAILMIIVASVFGVASQAAPAAAESIEQCGNAYYPSYSEVVTERYGTFFAVTFGFELSQHERDTLVCLQDWLEIEAPIAGFSLPDWWDEYTVSTNLPGALHDIDASDTEPVPAVTRIWTGDLQPNTWYYVTLMWDAHVPDHQTPYVTVQWVPAYWSQDMGFNGIERVSCNVAGGYSGNDAWCIFGANGQQVNMVQRIYGGLLPFNHGAVTYPLDSGIPSTAPVA